ncbi:MAG: MafI family immunity protein [Pseudomonadota bacterium]
MITYDYQFVENLLSRLLGQLLDVFTDSEKAEIQDFIDAGEYGLALETLADIVIEENRKISGESMRLVFKLADAMQLDKRALKAKLGNHITDS